MKRLNSKSTVSLTHNTVGKLVSEWRSKLSNLGVNDFENSLKWAGLHVSHKFADDRAVLTRVECDQFHSICDRLSKHEPLQYAIGEWDFYGRTFKMKPPTLIARSDTEGIIDLVLDSVADEKSAKQSRNLRFLEVGSGSGIISVTLLLELQQRRVPVECVAIDCCEHAVNLTMENMAIHGCSDQSRILQCSLSEFLVKSIKEENEYNSLSIMRNSFDMIVSNPPYVFTHEMSHLNTGISDFEDHIALDGGRDGLNVIRELLDSAPYLLKPEKTKGNLFIETHWLHPSLFQMCPALTHSVLGSTLELCEVRKDYSGLPRFLHFQN